MDKNLYRNDHWTLEDDLGLGAAGDAVARMALEVDPPFTLGVVGKWGSGKTSVMRRAFATLGGSQIRQALAYGDDQTEVSNETWETFAYDNAERNPPLDWEHGLDRAARRSLCVWYSPWQHQGEENPLIPLLLEIKAQFDTWTRIKEKAKTLNRRGGLAVARLLEHLVDAAATLSLGKGMTLARGVTDAVRKGWDEAEPDPTRLSDGQRFHLQFEDAIGNLLETLAEADDEDADTPADARLFLFIDDLDRCEEAVVVGLLEGIKLYLGSRRCVFVLGLDDTAVIKAMGRHWSARTDEENQDYLDKLFQATVAVPLPRTDDVHGFVARQLRAHRLAAAAARECAADIERLMEPNPRKIKNFVNSLCASRHLFHGRRRADTVTERRFVLFHYLRTFHHPVWRLLERQPALLALLHNVLVQSEDPLVIEGLDPDAQRMARSMFARAFSHVLRQGATDPDDRHQGMTLERAVDLFVERQDRKRSDEYLVRMVAELILPNTPLDPGYLHLAPPPTRRKP